jgi:hypothetical protein
MASFDESKLLKNTTAGPVKIDELGDLLTIADDGKVKLDGVTVGRRVLRDDKCYLQFWDPDRMRSQLRKTRCVEIPVDVFIQKIQGKRNGDKPAAHSSME